MRLLTWHERRIMKKQLGQWTKELDWVFEESYYTDQEYIDCVKDIFEHPVFQSMENYIQHGTTSTRTHCIQVSYFSYNTAKKLNLDYRACARAGLLHDLFLYDWHTHKELTGNGFHGFTHPAEALCNAERHFSLNKMERDIISKHMWPLTIIPPMYAESYIVSYADKYCSIAEIAKNFAAKRKTATV